MTLQPDFARQSIFGITRIVIASNGESTVRFPLHDLQVTAIDADGAALSYRVENRQLEVALGEVQSTRRELRITYHGAGTTAFGCRTFQAPPILIGAFCQTIRLMPC